MRLRSMSSPFSLLFAFFGRRASKIDVDRLLLLLENENRLSHVPPANRIGCCCTHASSRRENTNNAAPTLHVRFRSHFVAYDTEVWPTMGNSAGIFAVLAAFVRPGLVVPHVVVPGGLM